MSNLTQTVEQDCSVQSGCSALRMMLTPKEKDLGGFNVRRLIPVRQCRHIGPWVFFDHMGPAHFPAGDGIDVRPHPHIGLATVTYLFEGEMLHRDSLGNTQRIEPGAINLMVAGSGIVHSERQRDEVKQTAHTLHGLQLWLALPEDQEHTDPAFYHYDRDAIPRTMVNDVPVRVMMGQAYGLTSPVKTLSPTLYLEARLKAGQRLTLPEVDEKAVYVVDGRLSVRDTDIPAHSLAVFSEEPGIEIRATSDSVVVIIGGSPLGERFMEWNFVATRRDFIEQAKRDWRAGAFKPVPGDEEEYIPLPG